MIIIAVVAVAAVAVGGLVVYPRLQEQRAEQARLAQAEQHYQAGIAFQNADDWEAAEAEFKEVITLDAGYKDVQTRLAEVKTILAESAATATVVAEAQAEQARADAQATAAAASTATAEVLEAHYQRGLGYINLEQWAEAQAELRAVFDTAPNYKDVQAQLAIVNSEVANLIPTATPTSSATPTPKSTPTPTFTPTSKASSTRTPTPIHTATPTSQTTSAVGENPCGIIPPERCVPTTLTIRPRGIPQLTGEDMPRWSSFEVADPVVLYLDGALHLWFAGRAEGEGEWAIGYASSADGKSWQVHSTPVLRGGGAQSWDAGGVAGPSVLVKDSVFYMWYHGFDKLKDASSSIGFASSRDGIHWTPSPANPVIGPSSSAMWKSKIVRDPSVLYTDQGFEMYFAGGDDIDWRIGNFRIGYATSGDGVSWTEYQGNPILNLGARQSWEADKILAPDVLLIKGVYHMWYTGETNEKRRIGHATSTDGLLWVKDLSNPVLGLGAADGFASAGVAHPAVLLGIDGYHLWYVGTTERVGQAGQSIGYAFSDDGTEWVR